MKKFWKKTEGFTLVELIVVIAILGILAGVGTVGYSGYIKKANKQADITLASGIENALLLAHYGGTLEKGASVTVYCGDTDVTVEGTGADEAMKATFGDGYADALRLKSTDWDAGPAGDAAVMAKVESSNFKREEMGSLLDQVQTVVDAFSDYMAGSDNINVSLNPAAEKYLQMGGYSSETLTPENAQVIGNVMVFGVSETFSTVMADEKNKQDFKDAWVDGNFIAVDGLGPLAPVAAQYASVLGWAKEADRLTGDGKGSYYSDMLTAGVPEADALQKYNVINANMDKVLEEIFTKTEEGDDEAFTRGMEAYSTVGCLNDAEAFLAYMDGVTSTSGSVLENNDLNKQNFFNDGNVLDYVDNYFDASASLRNAPDGAMFFKYTGSESIFCAPDWAHK